MNTTLNMYIVIIIDDDKRSFTISIYIYYMCIMYYKINT